MLMVDVPVYLARIAYTGATAHSSATLRAIHRAHLLAVPFENLDIAIGRKIVLDEEAILHKILDQRRGGFCYELNAALAALLRALGFQVTLLSARVSRQSGEDSPEFDHLALRVDLKKPWLADVGFGESFLEPLRLEIGTEQTDPAGKFRLSQHGERLLFEKAEPQAKWKPQYSFTAQPRELQDFAARCRYHQTSPDSHFTQNRICSRATRDGRITLSGLKLILTRNGHREEKMLSSENEWSNVLRQHFGITL
jgi:N-hydroxyarylamine O-acetyltransferase